MTIENKGKRTSDNLKLTKIFNTHYINIVENSSGIPVSMAENPNNLLGVSKNTKIIQALSILENKQIYMLTQLIFYMQLRKKLYKIMKDINPKKATSLDKIPP